MKIKKISGLLSPLAKVLNLKSNSQEDTYSCDYINKLTEIIENENGRAIKFSDGIMICTKKITVNADVSRAWEKIYICNSIDLGNYAEQFIEIPSISMFIISGISAMIMNSANASNSSYGSIQLVRGFPSSGTVTVSLTAIGRWK